MFSSDPALFDWLVEVRRHFHMHPETSHQEYRTAEKIDFINQKGCCIQTCD